MLTERDKQIRAERLKQKLRARRMRTLAMFGSFGLAAIIVALVAIQKDSRMKHRDKFQNETMPATIIDKKDGLTVNGNYSAVLFFDTDGNADTAEAVAKINAARLQEMEELRRIYPGQVQQIGEWKKFIKNRFSFANMEIIQTYE